MDGLPLPYTDETLILDQGDIERLALAAHVDSHPSRHCPKHDDPAFMPWPLSPIRYRGSGGATHPSHGDLLLVRATSGVPSASISGTDSRICLKAAARPVCLGSPLCPLGLSRMKGFAGGCTATVPVRESVCTRSLYGRRGVSSHAQVCVVACRRCVVLWNRGRSIGPSASSDLPASALPPSTRRLAAARRP